MLMTQEITVIWLTGASCDGCTIKAMGDTTAGGLEALLAGSVPGLPRIRLVHPALSFETGEDFVNLMRAADRGDFEPFGLIVESSMPEDDADDSGLFPAFGEEDREPTSVGRWLRRLAAKAAFVIAWGDCAVWGGPHSIGINPMGATGVIGQLGWDYRSVCGLPVVHLPGCAPPPVLLSTVVATLKWLQGDGPPLELDELHRPRGEFDRSWRGAFTAWGV